MIISLADFGTNNTNRKFLPVVDFFSTFCVEGTIAIIAVKIWIAFMANPTKFIYFHPFFKLTSEITVGFTQHVVYIEK